MRDDEQISDQGEDFEVYERKRPRPEVRPGSVPDTSRGGSGILPQSEDAPQDQDDGAWLMTPPPAAPPTEPETPDMQTEPQGVMGRFFGQEQEDLPDLTDLPDLSLLPDPPAEPMRMDAAPGPAAAPEPSPPAPSSRPVPSSAFSSTPTATPNRGETMRIAIAATEFNYDITHMMIERARAHAEFLGASINHVVRVPGVYDLPLAVKKLLRRDDVDAVATLGVVIEGETDHDDLVIQHAARKIVDLSLEHDKPVGLGITGPGMSRLQAEARIDRAKDAVEACVKLHRTLGAL